MLRPFVVQSAHNRIDGRIFQLLLKRVHCFQWSKVLNLAILDHDRIVIQEYLHVIFKQLLLLVSHCHEGLMCEISNLRFKIFNKIYTDHVLKPQNNV